MSKRMVAVGESAVGIRSDGFGAARAVVASREKIENESLIATFQRAASRALYLHEVCNRKEMASRGGCQHICVSQEGPSPRRDILAYVLRKAATLSPAWEQYIPSSHQRRFSFLNSALYNSLPNSGVG